MSPTGRKPRGRRLPLDGVVVLDLGQIYQGPYAGFLLAMSGARVIKVEPPAGERGRARGATLPYAMLNSHKESTTIDLKHPDGVELFKDLATKADVVLMNYAPGVPERLGIGFKDLIQVNKKIIVAHASGFGVRNLDGSIIESSPPAMDITVQAYSGAMTVTGYDDTPPLKSGTAYIDFLGGSHLYGAITTALFERERTGIGRSVEVSMADAAHFTLASPLEMWRRTGHTARNGNRQASLGVAPYGVYRCADGWVAIITVAPRHWDAMVTLMGRQDLYDDERFATPIARARLQDEVDEIVTAWTSGLDRDAVVDALHEAHVPAAAVRTVSEAVRDERQIERRAIQWVDHPELGNIPLAASPIRWHDSPVFELEAAAPLGTHNAAVFSELAGRDQEAQATLRAAGVIL